MYAIISIILGVIFTYCFAPHHQIWLGFISISGLLICLDRAKTTKKAALYGFLFGFGHHVTALYWISYSLLVDADKFAWLIPFAVSLIPAYLSLYIAAICWLTKKLKYKGVAKIMFFCGAWVMAEIIRGHAFTGFPWNLAGYTFLKSLPLSQIASVIGFYGTSLLAILLFSSPFAVYYAATSGDIRKIGFSIKYLLPISMVFISISYWGDKRIMENKGKEEAVNIRIIQPNISQKDKFDPLRAGQNIYKYYSLTLEDSPIEGFVPDIIIWPEAATPYNLSKESEMRDELRDIIPYSSYLALGSVRTEGEGENKKFYNSIEFINSEGELEDVYYNKHHLVPFGEYMPLRRFLPGIEKLTHGTNDFSEGVGPQTLKIGDKPTFSPLICYEVIFPTKVVNKDEKNRPKWMLNVTNDAWFGTSKGPYQHLDISKARAIEEGIPMVRAANTGISAVIDSLGFVLGKVDLNKEGKVDIKLPASLHFYTFFSRFGLVIPIMLAGLFLSSAACLKFYGRSSP